MSHDVLDNLNIPLHYKSALREFIEKIRDLLNDIECIALVGSVARGEDFVEGWSDIDVLVVVKKNSLIDEIKNVVRKINEKYPKTRKGSGILSLWIDDVNNIFKWLGLGCEYYNIRKNFILLYGNDIRIHLREPNKDELKRTLKLFVKEARKHLANTRDEVLEHLDTLSIASYLYPVLRFYLCIHGRPTASRKEMIDILRRRKIKTSLSDNEVEALITVLEDLLARRQRVIPELNKTIIRAVEKIINEIDEYSKQ